jgi:DNA-binding response OmpR family regulator
MRSTGVANHVPAQRQSARVLMAFCLQFVLTMRVLIVDDYPGLVELYDFALGARGFQVMGAATVGEALTLAVSEPLDAVVLDMQLPDGSGAELAARLREIPALRQIPFVGMSSDASRAVTDGFDAFLCKPFHPKRLAAVLRRLRGPVKRMVSA